MTKKPISARIDEDTLTYIKECHEPVNTLINILLKKWIKDRQDKELLIWKENTGQDELSKIKAKENYKCSQCCRNCIYNHNNTKELKHINCSKTGILNNKLNINTFCCIYWDKKKGSK